uniref:SFRICE_025451 n=1 Tax=Spodoptera frugiperda TaxID=7108 RepID=A0A2H1WPU2_SPOFR
MLQHITKQHVAHAGLWTVSKGSSPPNQNHPRLSLLTIPNDIQIGLLEATCIQRFLASLIRSVYRDGRRSTLRLKYAASTREPFCPSDPVIIIKSLAYKWPLLNKGLCSHGESLSITHHTCTMWVGDFIFIIRNCKTGYELTWMIGYFLSHGNAGEAAGRS